MSGIEIRALAGPDVARYLDPVAALRIAVFRDWPYLYEGDLDYEAKYLAAYAKSPESVFVLAFDGACVIGASTGIPLEHETATFVEPFIARGIPGADVFYFGESVLLPQFRGRGLGHRFFDERERHARQLGRFRMTAFCAVERDADDPRCPPGHRSNDAFWSKRGYRRQDDMFCRLDWPEVGAAEASPHALRFWLRPLESA